MNIEKTIRDWVETYPNRFKISRCTAGSVSSSCTSPDAEGTSLVTLGRKSPDDVPVILTIWVAADGTSAFTVHTDEDNHEYPDEFPLNQSSDSEEGITAVLEDAVAAFCERYGLKEDLLGS